MSNWYYAKDGQTTGPLTFEALKSVQQAGGLSHPDAMVWQEGMADWVTPSSVEGLVSPVSNTAIQNPYAAPAKSANLAPSPANYGELPIIEPGSSTINIGSVLTKSWHTFKKYGGLLIGAGIIAIVVQLVLSIIAQVGLGVIVGIFGAAMGDSASGGAGIGLAIFSVLIFVVLQLSLQMFITLGIVKVGLNALSDNNPGINDLFSQGSNLLKTIGAGLLMYLVMIITVIPGVIITGILGGMGEDGPSGFGMFIGFLTIYIPIILVALRLGFFIPCIVDQNCGAVDSLKQSWAMTRNNFWVIVGLGIVATLINFAGMLALLIGLIVTMPVSYLMYLNAYRWMRHGFRSCDLN